MKNFFLIAIMAAGAFMSKLNAQVLRDSTGQRYVQDLIPGRTELKFADYEKYKQERIELLEQEKELITENEKKNLKTVIEDTDRKLEKKEITPEKAKAIKEKAAKIAAENIDNKTAIIDNHIALVNRDVYYNIDPYTTSYLQLGFGNALDENGSFLFGLQYKGGQKKPKYDKRTYRDVVVAIGFGNMAGDPYSFWKSTHMELGFTFRTRLLKNTNVARLVYGVSYEANQFTFNDNKYLLNNNGYSNLETFPYPLKKYSRFMLGRVVAPVYMEFGPSVKKEYKNHFRYDSSKSFKVGVGGFAGATVSSTQSLRYKENGRTVFNRRRADYNATQFVYGVAGYVGLGNVSFFGRYEINSLFDHSEIKSNALNFGLRIDM